jgi:hypothetical protein
MSLGGETGSEQDSPDELDGKHVDTNDSDTPAVSSIPPPPPNKKVKRGPKPPIAEQEHNPEAYVLHLVALGQEPSITGEMFEPKTYKQASNCDDARAWEESMEAEIEAQHDNKPWILTKLPKGKRALPNMWVFKVKPNLRKSRLVVCGNLQTEDQYGQTSSPVAGIPTIRLLLVEGLLARHDNQLDIKTAYLYGDIDAEIYMTQPKGFEQKGPNGEYLVCKLLKSLYGLRQAGYIWHTGKARVSEVSKRQMRTRQEN